MPIVFQVILGYVCYLKFDVGNVSFDINVSLNIFFLFYKSWLKKYKLIDQNQSKAGKWFLKPGLHHGTLGRPRLWIGTVWSAIRKQYKLGNTTINFETWLLIWKYDLGNSLTLMSTTTA